MCRNSNYYIYRNQVYVRKGDLAYNRTTAGARYSYTVVIGPWITGSYNIVYMHHI